MKSFFTILVKFLLRFYWLVMLVFIGLGALSVPRVIALFKNISSDPADLLPSTYATVQKLFEIRDQVEPKKWFGIVFESNNPEQTKKLLADIKPRLEAVPLVGKVYYTKLGHEFFDKYKMLFLEKNDLEEIRDRVKRKIEKEKLGPLYIDFGDQEDSLDFEEMKNKYRDRYGEDSEEAYFVSPDGKSFVIFAESKKPNLSMAEETSFQDEVSRVINQFDYKSYDSSMKVYFSGSTRVVEYRALIKDLQRAGLISGILIFLPLLIRFRRPDYVAWVFFPMLLGIPIGLGLASFWVPKLNVTTSFLFAILGGLGIETGIHLFSRFFERRGEGAPLNEVLLELYVSMGPAVLTAVASLAVTFMLMVFNDFKGFSEFGLISGVGLWTIFFLYFTFFPATLVLGEKLKLFRFKKGAEEKERSLRLSPSFVKYCLIFFCVITAGSIWAIPKVQFEYDSKKIRADNPEIALAKQKRATATSRRINSPALVLIHNEAEAEALKEAVDKIKESNPHSVLDSTRSIYSLVPKQQDEKLKIIDEIDELLSDDTVKLVKEEKRKDLDRFRLELKKSERFGFQDVPNEVKDFFLGKKDPSESLFLIYAKPKLELDNGLNAMAFADEIGTIKTSMGTFIPASDALVYAQVLRTMFRDSRKVMIIAVASVFFFVILDFRNLKKSAIVMFSILTGVLWVMGILYVFDIKLNLYNMVMIPAIMGMSIDNSIHIFHRYEELGKGSLARVLGTTGVSSLLASTTNAAGFFGLLFCEHGGLRSMGVVATIGLGTCLISTLVFLPMILQYGEWRREKKI